MAVPDDAFAGVFPTNSFNAHVVRRPEVFLVLINTGAFELMELLNALFFVKHFGSGPERVRLAAKYVQDYCDKRIFPAATELARTKPDMEYFDWQIHLVTAAEEFALGHEYGHIACGHVGAATIRLPANPGHSIDVKKDSSKRPRSSS